VGQRIEDQIDDVLIGQRIVDMFPFPATHHQILGPQDL
jgi:hypothetical protein